MHLEALEPAKPWRKYASRAAVGGLLLDLVPLEERHRRQMETFQDRLDTETVYLRHGSYFSAETRKSIKRSNTCWKARVGKYCFSRRGPYRSLR